MILVYCNDTWNMLHFHVRNKKTHTGMPSTSSFPKQCVLINEEMNLANSSLIGKHIIQLYSVMTTTANHHNYLEYETPGAV